MPCDGCPSVRFPLSCVECGAVRPLDAEPCPACGKPRWRHKTPDNEDFVQRVGEAQVYDAARFKPRDDDSR